MMKSQSLSGFARRARREWRVLDLPDKGQTFVVAVSGGADSSALLTALRELKTARKLDLNFVVAHFNHRLRAKESDADARFVEELAAQFEFDFVCGEWNREFEISNLESRISNRKENLEQSARNARYRFLTETARKTGAFAVLTGHTLNDQAETFLMRLIRGSGSDGLAAMKSIRKLETANLNSPYLLIRPLLNWAGRETTEGYCRECGIDFRVDSMNKDESFTRVRIRRELLPLLETFNPKIVRQLSQTAQLIGEDAEELNLFAQKMLGTDSINRALDIKVMKKTSPALRRRVVRLWLENARGSLKRLERKHLIAVDRLLLKGEGNSFIELPGGGIVIKKANLLFFEIGKG